MGVVQAAQHGRFLDEMARQGGIVLKLIHLGGAGRGAVQHGAIHCAAAGGAAGQGAAVVSQAGVQGGRGNTGYRGDCGAGQGLACKACNAAEGLCPALVG